MATNWGADVRVSLPVPPTDDRLITLGEGFSHSKYCMVFDMTEVDRERLATPTWAPPHE